MSTTTFVLANDPDFLKLKEQCSQTEKNVSQIQERPDSGLGKRFEDLKVETEKVLNKFAEDCKKLQEALETLATSQAESIKNYNIMKDEIRSLGGKLLQRQNPEPVAEVKTELGLSMFDLFED